MDEPLFQQFLMAFWSYPKIIAKSICYVAILTLTYFGVTKKLPKMLEDVGVNSEECERLQVILIFYSILIPVAYQAARRFITKGAELRKHVILGLTTTVICSQLLLGAVLVKKMTDGFELTLRLSYSLKAVVFVNVAALSLSPQMIYGMYLDAIAPQCSNRPSAHFLSNMGCALIRFFTALPLVIVGALFSSPTDYIPFFIAFLPLLVVNLMAHALEQPPAPAQREEEEA